MAASGEDCLGILLATGFVNVIYFHNLKAVIVKKKTHLKIFPRDAAVTTTPQPMTIPPRYILIHFETDWEFEES